MVDNLCNNQNSQINSFIIEEISNRFYANGRHQCQIRISVLKQRRTSSGLIKVPLTNNEIASLRPVERSSSLESKNLKLPNGWTSTNKRNQYNLGLINSSYSQPIQHWASDSKMDTSVYKQFDEIATTQTTEYLTAEYIKNDIEEPDDNNEQALEYRTYNILSLNDNNVADVFDFYISSDITGSKQIMATLELGLIDDNGNSVGTQIITTNMSDNCNNIFNSFISLEAITPFTIPNITPTLITVQDRKESVTKSDIHHQMITRYTWPLPFNLYSVSRYEVYGTSWFYNLGNTSSDDRFLTRGRYLALGYSQLNARDQMNGGCVWDFTYSATISDREISAEVLCVKGCSWTTSLNTGYYELTMIDNYGNGHRFKISPQEGGKTLQLARIGDK